MLRGKIARATAVAALAVAGVAALAGPTSADGVHLYQNDQYRGGYAYRADSEYTYHDNDGFNNGYSLADALTSLWNQTPGD
ncbi:hypothetical protein [Longispora albida]|uniref:hypothetical protein n=1 Tax=Longispora albida TaxID=203523 RepID=UPI00035C9908|nr:hypothetical protein [Longispora albida]